jgi:hypothetical protein
MSYETSRMTLYVRVDEKSQDVPDLKHPSVRTITGILPIPTGDGTTQKMQEKY